MRLGRRLRVIACCACGPALVFAACSSGGSGASKQPNDSAVPTATLPATLPDPLILGNGVVQASGGSTYTIKSGDTLATIAARFGVSLEDLRAANPGVDASALGVGATVKLPAGTSAEATAAPASDTPVAAAPTDTPPPAPPVETPTAEPPAPTDTPASVGQTYTVESGDIPVTIAQKFGITVEALLAANPGLDPRSLHIGDVIIIPPKPPA